MVGGVRASHPIAVAVLGPQASTDADLMARLTNLINRVYAVAEEGMWVNGTARTTERELRALTRSGQIAVAYLGGRPAGCVRIQRMPDQIGEFGMLAADPRLRGVGVGRELVAFAERMCRAGGAAVMQLEILVPREWKQPSKEFLLRWYTRIGYRHVRTGAIEEAYPDLAPMLATPCDFVIYHKDLTPASS
jgi:GNAT superfamily N-acetyltransferase